MRTRLIGALALAALIGTALTACGGSTKTVNAESQGSTNGRQPSSTSTTTTTGTTILERHRRTQGGSGSAPQGTTQSQTRTAAEPQFDQSQSAPQEAQQAATVVSAHGFTADNLSEYHPNQTLRALVGTRSGSADGYGQQVFFFVDGHFIGTDTKEPSASLKVVSQGDTETVVEYRLYRPATP